MTQVLGSSSSSQSQEVVVTAKTGADRQKQRQQADTLPAVPVLNGETKSQSIPESGRDSTYWPPTAEWALVFITAMLAIYTARLWGATKRLAHETKNSSGAMLEHMETVSQQQLRPYISVDVKSLDAVVPRGVSFGIRLKNHGQTPAIRMHFSMTSRLLEFPLSSDHHFVDCVDSDPDFSAVLHPGASTNGLSNALDNPLTEADAEAWRTGTRKDGTPVRFYCYGIVEYADAFGKQHWTTFCEYYGRETIERAVNAEPGTAVVSRGARCHLHNDIGTYPEQPRNR